jgi:alpha-tubulin suppressor-like RCC1 family protein
MWICADGPRRIPARVRIVLAFVAVLTACSRSWAQGVVSFGGYVIDSRVFEDRWTKVEIGGGGHFVGILRDGSAKCWGSNSGVCIIDGSVCTVVGGGQVRVPDDLGPVIDVAAGTQHTVAVRQDGAVRCWGFNSYGQCAPPSGLGPVTRVAAGDRHSVALTALGTVRCWGSNAFGQSTPPSGLSGVTEINAQANVSIACRSTGTVALWGQYASGQLAVPVGLAQVQRVACGFSHAVALQAGGVVRCWGSDAYGQCAVPAQLGTVTAVAAGSHHTLALRADGSVRAWGAGAVGQSGFPHEGQSSVPTDLSGVVSIDAAANSSAAVLADGSVRFWGRYWGWPKDAPDLRQLAVGTDHRIALWQDGSFSCVGENWAGQCSPPAGIGPLRAVAASSYVSLGIDVNGRLWGWGTTEAALLQFPPDLGSLQAIAASGHAVALRVDGTVRCWGLNGVGQCNVPPSAVGVSRVSASVEGSLVTKGTGEVLYWGSSSYGIQTIPADLGPVIVAQLGGSHAIALRADGVVRCWGSNGAGQCNVPLGTVDWMAG